MPKQTIISLYQKNIYRWYIVAESEHKICFFTINRSVLKNYKIYLIAGFFIILFSSGLTYSVLEHISYLEDISLASSIIVAIVEIGGLIAIWYQLKKQKDVEVANFLLEFEKSFIEHKPIFRKIEESREENTLTNEDISGIVRYLTFYESLYYFIQKGVLSIEMVDDLFGYRFFLAMHCEFIQEHNLKPYHEYYQNVFNLYNKWYKFREDHGFIIPRSYNRLNTAALTHQKRDLSFRTGKLTLAGKPDTEKNRKSYEMKLLREDQLDMLMELQQKVYDEIDDEEVFQLTTKEEFQIRAQEKGRILGVFVEDRLAAFLALYFPGKDDEENLGRDIGLSGEELDKVAYFESLAVDSAFRGNNLQQKMQQEAYDLVAEIGYTHLMATVSHKNYYSLKNMMAFRFKVAALKEKYGGKLRYITHRNIRNECVIDFNQNEVIPNIEVNRQQELLQLNYMGYQVHPGAGMKDFKISYAPVIED